MLSHPPSPPLSQSSSPLPSHSEALAHPHSPTLSQSSPLSVTLSLTLIAPPVGDHQQFSRPVLHEALHARLAGSHPAGRSGGMTGVDEIHLAVAVAVGGNGMRHACGEITPRIAPCWERGPHGRTAGDAGLGYPSLSVPLTRTVS